MENIGLAVGFCATCCIPLPDKVALRKDIDGERMFFCSDRCNTRYRKHHPTATHW